MTMNRRKDLTKSLNTAINSQDWNLCAEICFKIIMGLPSELQIELCNSLLNGYLVIFEKRNPKIKWPRKVLNNPQQWAKKYFQDFPVVSNKLCVPDSIFIFCLDPFMLAHWHNNNDVAVTSCCACLIYNSICARSYNVWLADDPAAFNKDGSKLISSRNIGLFENDASVAILKREWLKIANWLNKKKIWLYSDNANINELNKIIKKWREKEMLMILPNQIDFNER
jgi:hypothetical protein